jgi:periplasmic protein TonB
MNRPFDEQHGTWLILSALILSLVMHFAIMRALPWLEAVRAKPPIAIMAELMQPPPPPPAEAPAEPKPDESITKPEVVKVEQLKPKPQAAPVLTSRHADSIDNRYVVPETPQPAIIPSESAAPVAEASTETVAATPSASSNAASSPSTSNWDDSDVWDEFGSNLQKLCERYKRYPEIARRRGWQGSGAVVVRFSKEGKTLSITIEQSTGQNSLDDQALEMVRKSLADLPLPTKFRGREFKLTIPVDFKLE